MASDHLEDGRVTEPDNVSCNTADPAATVSLQPEIPNSEASGHDVRLPGSGSGSPTTTDSETRDYRMRKRLGKQPVERDDGGSQSNPENKTVVDPAPLKPLKPSNEPPLILGGKRSGGQMSYEATKEATGTHDDSEAGCGAGCDTCQACCAGCLNACLPWKALDGLGVPDDDDEEALRAFAQWNNSRP